MIRVSQHAIDRYRERVADAPDDIVRALIEQAVENAKAVEFGARYVKLGTGQRIVVEDGVALTVLVKEQRRKQMSMAADRRRYQTRAPI